MRVSCAGPYGHSDPCTCAETEEQRLRKALQEVERLIVATGKHLDLTWCERDVLRTVRRVLRP